VITPRHPASGQPRAAEVPLGWRLSSILIFF
jgi:hypothetical protein